MTLEITIFLIMVIIIYFATPKTKKPIDTNKIREDTYVKCCLLEWKRISNNPDYWFPDLLRQQIKASIKNGGKHIVRLIREEKMTAPSVVFLIIKNLTEKLLLSCEYHIYYGILSVPGHELLKTWHFAVNELEKNGALSHETAMSERQRIRFEISHIG